MTAGHDDLQRAAEALAARIPEPLAPLARLAYNYRWSWTPGGPELFRGARSRPLGALRREPRPPARRRSGRGARARRRRRRAARARGRASRRRSRADLARPPADGAVDAGPSRRVLLRRVRRAPLAADLLRRPRRARRRHPQGGRPTARCRSSRSACMYRQGYFRQRIDAGGWQHEYWVDTDPERLPAALVTGADGAPLTVTVPVRDIEVTAQIWRVDVGRVPLYLLDAERPENDLAARWITSRLYIGDPDARLAQYVLLGVGGMRALAGDGHRARRCCTSTRATRRSSSLEVARARRAARSPRARGRPGADDLHHAHAGPGRQRHLPGRPGRATRCAGLADELGVDAERDHPPRPHASRRRARAVRRDASSRCARAAPPTASAAATARSRAGCGTACGRTAPSTTCRSATSPTASTPDLARRADARAARPPPRRGLARARGRPGDLGAGRRHPRRGAVGGAPARSAPSSSTTCASKSVADRLGRDEPRDVRRGRRARVRPRRADDRLRPPARDLQAAAPARRSDPDRGARAARRRPAACSSCSPARRTRATTRASASSSTCSRSRARPRSPARAWSSSTTTTSRCARPPGPRLRRLAQPPAPAAGGERHERHEVGRQRRPAAQRARRLVGRGLRRRRTAGRCSGEVDDDHGAQDHRDARELLPAARARRSCPSSTTATTTASRARGSRA